VSAFSLLKIYLFRPCCVVHFEFFILCQGRVYRHATLHKTESVCNLTKWTKYVQWNNCTESTQPRSDQHCFRQVTAKWRSKVMLNFWAAFTLSPPSTTKVPYANSLNPDEPPSNSTSHPLFDTQTIFSSTLSNIKSLWKIETDEKFIWRAKG